MPKWKRLGRAWDQLGDDNALGAILTRDGQVADWGLDEFMSTGRDDVARFAAELARIVPAAARTRALDFGSGVGRISRALADHFDEVVGVDAAPSMIQRARSLNADRPACTFVLNRAPHLRRFASGSFSVVYSRLVLQDLRPALVRRYLPELVRVLAPGGALMFQLPENVRDDPRGAFERAPVLGNALKRRLPRPIVTAYRRLKYYIIVAASSEARASRRQKRRSAQIEMYGMARAEVLDLIRRAGGRVLEVRDDQSHGYPTVPGFEYWVTR